MVMVMTWPQERLHRGLEDGSHQRRKGWVHRGTQARTQRGTQDLMYRGTPFRVHRGGQARVHRGAPLALSFGVLLACLLQATACGSDSDTAASGCSHRGVPEAHLGARVHLQRGGGQGTDHTQGQTQGLTRRTPRGVPGAQQGYAQGHRRGAPVTPEPGWAMQLLGAARILLQLWQRAMGQPHRNAAAGGGRTAIGRGVGASIRMRIGAGKGTERGAGVVRRVLQGPEDTTAPPPAASLLPLATPAPVPAPRAVAVEVPVVPEAQMEVPVVPMRVPVEPVVPVVPDPELISYFPWAQDMCGGDPLRRFKAEELSNPPHLPWTPARGKYLFPLCHWGRLSNQQLCMRSYSVFAALLNRTLVIPRLGFKDGVPEYSYKWKWDEILDVPGMRACLSGDRAAQLTSAGGSDVSEWGPQVVTLDELLEAEGRECLGVDHITWFGPFNRGRGIPIVPRGPGLCEGFAWSGEMLDEGAPVGETVPWDQIQRVQGLEQRVISLGVLFGEKIPGMDLRQPVAPFDVHSGCGDLWVPPQSVSSLVSRITEAFSSGKPYAAMHLRRGDFAVAQRARFHNIPSIARAILPWLGPLQVSLLYLATDASPVEIEELEQLLGGGTGQTLKVVTMHQLMGDWREELEKVDSLHSGLVTAVVEKYICASAAVFLGTLKSTFSNDIVRIRVASSQASCSDKVLS